MCIHLFMKKKTLFITFVSIAFVTLVTLGLLMYGAFQGVAFLIRQAGPQVNALQAQGFPDQVSGLWDQLQNTIKTPECQSAIGQVTNLQVWLVGGAENLIPQIGLACLGSYFKSDSTGFSENEEIPNEII